MNFLKILLITLSLATSCTAAQEKYTGGDLMDLRNEFIKIKVARDLKKNIPLQDARYARALKSLKKILFNNPELVYGKDENEKPIIVDFLNMDSEIISVFINNGFDVNTPEGFNRLEEILIIFPQFIIKTGNISKNINLILDQASDKTLSNAKNYVQRRLRFFSPDEDDEDKELSNLIDKAQERKKQNKEIAKQSQPILKEFLPNDLALLIADYVSQGGIARERKRS